MSGKEVLQAFEPQPPVLRVMPSVAVPEKDEPAIERGSGTTAEEPKPQPSEPRSSTEIAAQYGASQRTFLDWYKIVRQAYFWVEETDLRKGVSDKTRYTPLFQELLTKFKKSGLTQADWIASVHAANADKLPIAASTSSDPIATARRAAAQRQAIGAAESPAIRPDVLPPQNEPQGDRSAEVSFMGGMVLHLGSVLNLPEIAGVVAPGNDTAYLTQAQQRLEQFAALQQQVIAQMQQQQQQSQELNSQFQEATSLSDQLLLQEYQLQGVQLGFTALQVKQQAFKATVQAAEAGTLPVPGKPQAENTPTPSA